MMMKTIDDSFYEDDEEYIYTVIKTFLNLVYIRQRLTSCKIIAIVNILF